MHDSTQVVLHHYGTARVRHSDRMAFAEGVVNLA